uniref:Protein UNC80 C-terminal domain-containing protein n=1 Tax=Tetranychus urticae TaxID=32264 RepID=T1K5F4_TETUR
MEYGLDVDESIYTIHSNSFKVADLHQKNSSYELLDVKCHLRLAEVAHALLKLSPYDPQTMACRGLVRYMNEALYTNEF